MSSSITEHTFIFELCYIKMGLQSRRTFLQWFLKFFVQTPLIIVVRYRLVEVLTQMLFIEFKIRMQVSHHAFVLKNMIALDLDSGLFATSEVIDVRQVLTLHASQFFTDRNSKNLAGFGFLYFTFFETHQEVSFLVQLSLGDPWFV